MIQFSVLVEKYTASIMKCKVEV